MKIFRGIFWMVSILALSSRSLSTRSPEPLPHAPPTLYYTLSTWNPYTEIIMKTMVQVQAP